MALRRNLAEFHNPVVKLDEEIEKAVKSWEKALDRQGQEGGDWFQLTVAEEEVFDIESWRWARMLTAWEFYEDLIDIVDPHHFDDAMIEAERKNWPALRL